ncbi:MAG: antitoxin family protein [Methanophagales archaeon]|nr:antitoxin family protein [Methanophagales archaeon]
MKMQKAIEVVYEKGVFKPLEKVDLEVGKVITIRVTKIESDIQTAKSILSMLDSLPKRKVDLKLAEELYHEGKSSS